MRVVQRKDKKRTVYAWEDNGLFFISNYAEAVGMRRPMTYFEDRDELLAYAQQKNVAVEWLPQ